MLAIFDVDGVILDSMGYCNNISERYLLKNNITPEKNLSDKMFSMSFKQGSEYVAKNYPIDKSAETIKIEILEGLKDFYFNEVGLKDGALGTLKFLKNKNIEIIVATFTDKFLIEGAFNRLQITDYFTKIYSPDTLKIPKSSIEFLKTILKDYKINGEDAILFEDGLYSVINAKKLMINTVGIYDEASKKNREKLKREADLYLDSLKDYRGEFLWKKHLQ